MNDDNNEQENDVNFMVVPDTVREEARTTRSTGGKEPEDLKALREGKTIFIEGDSETVEKRVKSLRVTISYHRARKQENRILNSRQMELDGRSGKVVWLEEPDA